MYVFCNNCVRYFIPGAEFQPWRRIRARVFGPEEKHGGRVFGQRKYFC